MGPFNMKNIGNEIFNFAKELWDIPRSITGKGLRKTLQRIQEKIPELKIYAVPSGTKAFDWTIPKEWNVNDAYIISPDGTKFCDFTVNNLHLVGYSSPISASMNLEELQTHLHSIPEKPNAIPYVTSYYKENWGFCITEYEREKLLEGTYHVFIDSKLENGFLNYGEVIIEGKTNQEVFISTYVCHPSMANNELSGPCLTTFLAKYLIEKIKNPKYTYRFIFIPETIGSIVYLSQHVSHLKSKVIAGFNVSCVGDERCYSYLPSRAGDSLSDKIAVHVLKWTDPNFKRYTWLERGSDERQYCSPGIDLPIATIMRSKYATYPEYHTSLDTLGDVVTAKGLQESYKLFTKVIDAIECNIYPVSKVLAEPQMSHRNLYSQLSSGQRAPSTKVMMDFLSYSDGSYSLLEIAEILNVPIWETYHIFKTLESHQLAILK
jgi:aminopeptidase-like protein